MLIVNFIVAIPMSIVISSEDINGSHPVHLVHVYFRFIRRTEVGRQIVLILFEDAEVAEVARMLREVERL